MRGVKKSRNGCARCKDKRLKCDEAKPACGRCVRRGVACPGYAQSLRWSTKYEVFTQSEDQPRAQDTQPEPTGPSQYGENELMEMQPPASMLENLEEQSTIGIEDWPSMWSSITDDRSGLDDSLGFDFDPTFAHFLKSPDPLTPKQSLHDHYTQLEGSGVQPLGRSVLGDAFSPLFPITTPQLGLGDQETLLENERNQQDHSIVLARPSHRATTPGSPTSEYGTVTFPIDRSLTPTSLMLVEYYFKEVAAIFSCYDSQMNPFRTTVSRLWNSSPSIYHVMQSMAAACLADDFPQLNGVGVQLRQEATTLLQTELDAPDVDDKSLLALIMLGQTASWHDPKDLGIAEFNRAKRLINSMLLKRSPGQSGSDQHNLQFFREAIIYWEMLLSYVAESDELGMPASEISRADTLTPNFVPHPWTGIAREAQLTVYEVGKLIRGERIRIRSRIFTSRADIKQIQQAINIAQGLEERLLAITHPSENAIINPKDDRTPVRHLLDIAEVYRCIGLLQLYRVFPDLLSRRLRPGASSPDFGTSMDGLAMHISQASGSPGFGSNVDLQDEESVMDSWLTHLAMYSLDLLKSIPLESRTKCVQPFLLVAGCSELRLSNAAVQVHDISLQTVNIVRTRKFITSRLTSFLHFLPPKPIHVLLELVRETWARMDSGEHNVYWMDIMIENGWETTMG